MMHGVPGTGTRDGGKGGSLLRVNLDNIVMLRFHRWVCIMHTCVLLFKRLEILTVHISLCLFDALLSNT